jgi:hypothetical protein
MNNLSEIEHDVEQARDNLARTLDEVNRKAANTGSELRIPEHQIRRFPVASLCGAVALGLAAGGSRGPAIVFGAIALGSALFGHKACDTAEEDGLVDHSDFSHATD